MKKFCAALIAGVTLLASFAPSQALPINPVPSVSSSDVQQVRHRSDHRPDWRRNANRRDWRANNRRSGWYNGHRGYRDRRPGYRRHSDGFWYPLAIFGAGAVIGGAINNSRPVYSGGNAHVRWCSDRYRTYRAYDNTYVPKAGVRATCMSPYR